MNLRVNGKVTHNVIKKGATEENLGFGDARQGPGPGRARLSSALVTGPGPLPTHSLKFLKYSSHFIGWSIRSQT